METNSPIFQILIVIIPAVITGFVGWYLKERSNRRGNWVLVSRISEATQIQIGNAVAKDKLSIIYDGKNVKNLVLNILEIINDGNLSITPFEIELKTFWAGELGSFAQIYSINDPMGKTSVSTEPNGWIIKRDFLNTRKTYKNEKIQITFISDAPLNFTLSGGGQSWSAKYLEANFDLNKENKIIYSIMISLIWVVLIILNIRNFSIDITSLRNIFSAPYITTVLLFGLGFLLIKLFRLK